VSEDTHEVRYEEYEESWTGRLIIAGVVALALIAGAFFAGKALAGDSGPATLAEAVQAAQKGDLPCGESATATPAGTPDANGAPPAAGGGFLLRGICDQDGQTGQARGGRFGGFGGQTVTAVSADSITVDSPNGPTTVKIGADTTVNTSASASVADIKKGDSVMVAGAGGPGAAARSITILPQSSGS
jgi:hypothetical protein